MVRSPNIIFFFGAGASKPAGIGTTLELVTEFNNYLVKMNNLELSVLLKDIIKKSNFENIDIEQLMIAIDKLSERDEDILLKFYDDGILNISNSDKLPQLKDELKKFIRETTTVSSSNVGFLGPILNFQKPIQIFSVNYDTLIEQFCNTHKLKYTDGFEFEWNLSQFEDESRDFHLYKIHGSIMWYKTGNNNYVKLPIPSKDKVELIFGEEAIPLILYPMQKWEFVEPLLELLMKFKDKLQKSNFVVVVGYSFRDSHIVRLFIEAARKNQELIIILVSPDARNIFDKKLKYYITESGQRVDSILNERVICLEYGFEKIIGKLKNIINSCNKVQFLEKKFEQSQLIGEKQDPEELLSNVAEIEYLELANKIKNKIIWPTTPHATKSSLLVTSFKLLISAEIQNIPELANFYLKQFLKLFDFTSKYFSIYLTVQENAFFYGHSDKINKNDIEELKSFIGFQRETRRKKFTPLINFILKKLDPWIWHYYGFLGRGVDYFELDLENQGLQEQFGIEPWPKTTELFAYIGSDNLIEFFETNNEHVRTLIREFEDYFMSYLSEGESSMEALISKKFPERLKPEK